MDSADAPPSAGPGRSADRYPADGPSDTASAILSAWLWDNPWPGYSNALNDRPSDCLRIWATAPTPPGLVAAFDHAGVADRVVVERASFTSEEMLEAARTFPLSVGLEAVGADQRGRGITVGIAFDAPAPTVTSVPIGSGVAVPVVAVTRSPEPKPGDPGPADLRGLEPSGR